MSRATQQLREGILREFPDARISRKNCRDTESGWVSQHSAYDYGEYDSNALDIMGGPVGWTWDQNVALIDEIVTEIEKHRDEWSIRLILWKVPNHFGHAHVDTWPTCITHKWCGRRNVDPLWETSTGVTFTDRDPDPENGDYAGPQPEEDSNVTYEEFVRGIVTGWDEDHVKTEKEFNRLYDEGKLEGQDKEVTVSYWMGLLPDPSNNEWLGFYARTTLATW